MYLSGMDKTSGQVQVRVSQYRNNIGLYFIFYSASDSCEFMVGVFNKFLLGEREYLSRISDRDFGESKASILRILNAPEKSMHEDFS